MENSDDDGDLVKLQSKLKRAVTTLPGTQRREKHEVSERPTLADILQKYGRYTIKVRTGLTEEQFCYVLNLLKEVPEPPKRGRELLDLDLRLAITLQWIQLCQTFLALADSFESKPTRVQTAIATIWNPLADVLFEALIPADPREYISSRKFINYPEAIGALDATLLPLLKPKTKEENIGDMVPSYSF